MHGQRMRVALAAGLAALASISTAFAAGEATDADESTLPPAATAALHKALPNAEVSSVEMEQGEGGRSYSVVMHEGARQLLAEVTESGILLQVAEEVERKEIPVAVLQVCAKAAPGGHVEGARKKDIYAERHLALPAPKVVYEVEIAVGRKMAELDVEADGKVVRPLDWGGEGGADGR